MPYIEWQEEYSVGIQLFDEQHRRLIAILNQVHEAVAGQAGKPTIRRIFVELAEYTDYHFRAEESLLELYDFPFKEEHKKQHLELSIQLLDLQIRFREGDYNISNAILTFLNEWLVNHILSQDKEYSTFLNGKGVF